jgi:hypothetical protein
LNNGNGKLLTLRRIRYLTKHHEDVREGGGMEASLHALTSALGTDESSVSRPTGKKPPVPRDRRLGGPESQSGHSGEDKKIPAPTGTRTAVVLPVA